MNRHGYKIRKFGRERDQRRALLKGLANDLIISGSIETTLPKAKETVKYTEKLVSQAKKAKSNLHIRRQIIASLTSLEAAHKLVDEVSPKLEKRSSGYFSLKRTGLRRGDGGQMAKVSFVDDLGGSKTAAVTKPTKEKPEADQDEGKQSAEPALRPEKNIESHAKQVDQAPKRSGRRGNR